MEQLKACIDSIHLDLNKEIMNEIRSVHKEIPNPSP
jgi:aryl-alcohol dehydrogenase-like predicted oxidoreductase